MDDEKILLPGKFEGMSIFRPPLCHELCGKEFTLVMDDGYDRKVVFTDRTTLLYGKTGEAPESFAYDCLKAEARTYFINFEKPGLSPRVGWTNMIRPDCSSISRPTIAFCWFPPDMDRSTVSGPWAQRMS